LPGADRELEAALSRLVPARPSFTAQDIMAQSLREAQDARRSAGRQAWVWRGVAGALAASLLFAILARAPASLPPRVIVKVVHVPSPITSAQQARSGGIDSVWTSAPATSPDIQASNGGYLELRDRVLVCGLTGIPESSPAAAGAGQPVRVRAFGPPAAAPSTSPDALHALLQSFARPFIFGDPL